MGFSLGWVYEHIHIYIIQVNVYKKRGPSASSDGMIYHLLLCS